MPLTCREMAVMHLVGHLLPHLCSPHPWSLLCSQNDLLKTRSSHSLLKTFEWLPVVLERKTRILYMAHKALNSAGVK